MLPSAANPFTASTAWSVLQKAASAHRSAIKACPTAIPLARACLLPPRADDVKCGSEDAGAHNLKTLGA